MATKKTTTTAKTKTKKPTTKKPTVKKTVAKKTSAKVSKPVPKTVHATEPYHPVFGIILLVVCIIMASFLIAWGCCSYVKSKTDAAKFAAEYTEVSEKNVYAIKDGEEIIDILEDGTGVVFLGYPACPWCQRYAAMLNDMAKEYGIKTIYYHDTYEDWQNDTEDYRKLTEILSDHLQFDNVGNRHLYVPDSVFVVDGEIVGNDWETSKDTLNLETPDEYWTEERVTAWKEKLAPLFEKVKAAEK